MALCSLDETDEHLRWQLDQPTDPCHRASHLAGFQTFEEIGKENPYGRAGEVDDVDVDVGVDVGVDG